MKLSNNLEVSAKELAVLVVGLVGCFLPFVNGAVALIAGMVLATVLGDLFAAHRKKAISWLLKVAIIGLGFRIHFDDALQASKDGLVLTVTSIVLVFVAAYLAGKFLKIGYKLRHLIATGTAICGGSAIAIMAPTIDADEKDISLSIGVVFLLNALALLIFPPLGHALGMSQADFGLWSAVAIHDTSSVVGASQIFGPESMDTAITVKLARTLWIIPMVLITSLVGNKGKKRINLPWFILIYLIAVALNSWLDLPTFMTSGVPAVSSKMLIFTLFLVGLGLPLKKVQAADGKSLILGSLLWVLVGVFSLLFVLNA